MIAAGEALRIGRSPRADLALPWDGQLSGLHFALEHGEAGCRLRDLSSAAGTELNGERTEVRALRNGDWIRAGETDFMIYFEGATPPLRKRATGAAEALDAAAKRERALAALRAEPAPLFAIMAAARSPRALVLMREAVEPHQSLYEGVEGEALAGVAPYLAQVPAQSRLLEALVREGWGDSWGIYLSCARPLKEVRRHLRRFLMVEDEETRARRYFRFYDPRALREFLPTCSVRQLGDFFGDIASFIAEGEDGEVLLFTKTGNPPAVGE